MAFQVSPGINVSEYDLTTGVPAVSTTEAAIAGVFSWGPVNQRVLVSSEDDLVSKFGKPTASNFETFFTAADFLSYSNKLYAVRVVSTTANNAVGTGTAAQFIDETTDTTVGELIAKWPGTLGNNLKVSICPTAAAFSSAIAGVTMTIGANTATVTDAAALVVGDILRVGSNSIGWQNLTVTAIDSTTVSFTEKLSISADLSAADATRKWGYYKSVAKAPSTNRVHIVVVDENGGISGIAGTVLEVYQNVSINANAKNSQGASIYYGNAVNNQSKWVRATGDEISAAGTLPSYTSLAGGTDGSNEGSISIQTLKLGYDLFVSPEEIDISLILQGKARGSADDNYTGLANYIIDNICEVRRDCVLYVSPHLDDVVNNPGDETDDILAFRESITSTSYAILDSGYKYRYDKYSDRYRWIPLNGDMAGLAARTDMDRDPWWSPAGYNRGVIKNVVKLAFNPTKAQRDILYPNDINPVISQPGSGVLLFGDKTLAGLDSAFDRINVRRLFIVLEKAIARASRGTLFEFNDSFTRAQFRNIVEPFLRDVQGRRGIYDFKVVCDETNSTPDIIDRGEFRGDIYIKPARAINYIQLNFVAVRTGVEFEEIVGQF